LAAARINESSAQPWNQVTPSLFFFF
jgi:hypothetical protein